MAIIRNKEQLRFIELDSRPRAGATIKAQITLSRMTKPNVFYAQSGGVTAVINATAAGVIETARTHKNRVGKVIAGLNGITGALNEELVDTSRENPRAISALMHTPAGAYGSCRYRMQDLKKNRTEYLRLIEVFKAHNIGYFLYNGGGDSQDTTHKVSLIAKEMGFPITCVGIPKTVDNDLPHTDCCPGFGSVAKYVAVSTREAGLDVASMCETSTKVFILEVMGRHTGWIAAAAGLAGKNEEEPPHSILFPEIAFDRRRFLARVRRCVRQHGYCVIVVSEGLKNKRGRLLSDAGTRDAFGHKQLGGVALLLAETVKRELGFKYHWALADYLQRSARHIASATDVDQAYTLGCAAVEFALEGRQAVMATIVRRSNRPYRWNIGAVALESVANREKKMPRNYITEDGFHITRRARTYLEPLIQGEPHPPYKDGVPDYVRLRNVRLRKKLPAWKKDK